MRPYRPLLLFFPLSFLLSWYPYLLGKTGWVKTSGGINPLGVMVAGIIVAGVCYRGGVKELLGRYLRWRISWENYAFALLVPVVIALAGGAINVLLGAPQPTRAQLAAWPEILPAFVFIFLFVGLGEETGWRGLALPGLQKHFSPLASSLILGVIWAAWHVPLFGVEFQAPVIPAFLVSVLAASVVCTWLFNRSRGSLLPLPTFHAAVNSTGAGYVFRMFTGGDTTRLWWIDTSLWVIAAAAAGLAFTRSKEAPVVIASPLRNP